MKKISVMFVCLGNICRSPMAEAVFRKMVADRDLTDHFIIASSGTGHWHLGEPPHVGTRLILSENKIEVGNKRSQLLKSEDFQNFDYVIAMAEENVDDIQFIFKQKVRKLLEFAAQVYTLDVPDPYYENNFEEVYKLVTAGCKGLLDHIIQQEGL
ncbi:MAG TPA: low molecular weight protein-tyrosine-phosphatase [Anaerolineaceae bacterium]|nr:low molecular weight protein-tyrosine-phosphatase [Anaerolineaceae bacterium]